MIRTLHRLQLDGGCLVFDFINTVNTRKPVPEFEYLKTFEDFLEWSAKVESLPGDRLQLLREHAATRQATAITTLRNAIDVRENLYRLFSAMANGKSPDPTVVDAFNERLSLTFQKIHMRFDVTRAEIHFNEHEITLDEPLHPIIKSAFDTLTREDFGRLKECPRCGWLFLDTSRNGKRKWCDMRVCGSREKALEYYYRKTKTA